MLTLVRAGLCTKEERAAKMGMTALTSDVAAQRRALQMTFLEAESCASSRLAEVDAVRAAVENACGIKLPPSPAQATVRPPLSLQPEALEQTISILCISSGGQCARHASKSTRRKWSGRAVQLPAKESHKFLVQDVHDSYLLICCCRQETAGEESGASSAQTEEFVDLLASIAELRKQIEGMDRPDSLPPPGQPLPMEEVCSYSTTKYIMTYADVMVHVCLHSVPHATVNEKWHW